MELQSVCRWLKPPKMKLSNHQPLLCRATVAERYIGFSDQRVHFGNASYMMPGFKSLRIRTIIRASNHNSSSKISTSEREIASVAANGTGGVDPFRGKPGSVSFHGLTHELVEEGKLVSAPFKEGTGSFLWLLAPVALLSSLLLPQFFLGTIIDAFFTDMVLAEIAGSFISEAMFYVGLITFLLVTDNVQRPYLQFSSKRWGLITGLRGYLSSVFYAMGFKVFAPISAVYVTWPVLGLPALVAVLPFLVGCATQLLIERYLDYHESSCWPLVPIIFEVYRLYQLSKAANFMERLMFLMRGSPVTPELLERSNALASMVVAFQVLGVVCLWSLITFLLRLFPSRPVSEKY